MIPFSLSKTEADIVNIERKTHKSTLVRDRMSVLHLLHMGFKRKEVAAIVGCHVNSVTNYVKLYRSGGLGAVRQLGYSYDRHELSSYYEKVEDALTEAECTTVEVSFVRQFLNPQSLIGGIRVYIVYAEEILVDFHLGIAEHLTAYTKASQA